MKYDLYASDLGFKKIDNVWTLEYNGYLLYLKDWNYMVLNIPSFYIPLDKEIKKEVLKEMEVASLDNAVSAISLNGSYLDTLIISLPDGKKTLPKVQLLIMNQINNVTKKLEELGFKKMTQCPICKKEAQYMKFIDNYCPMHIECKDNYLSELMKNNEENSKFSKKYIFMCLLVIIGALVGLVPALILTLLNYDYYFSGILALSPILAVLGFVLSKAPYNKFSKIFTGIVVFLSVIGFVSFAIPFMANGKEKSISEYLFSGKWVGARRILFGIIISLAGFGLMRYLKNFKKDTKKEIEKLKEDRN